MDSKTKPFVCNDTNRWLIISDLHIPYADKIAVNAAVNFGKKYAATAVLINGDLMDAVSISSHVGHNAKPKYKEEIELTRSFLSELRRVFPSQFILYKYGNHEERLLAYIDRSAREFEGVVVLDELLGLKDLGVVPVDDKRKIQLGKLNVFHGHEFNGGGGKNPANWLYNKAGGGTCNACGHFHRIGFYQEPNANDYKSACWAVGCLCNLKPFWCKYNGWAHGFATCEIARGGAFVFHNYRIGSQGEIMTS